MDNAFAFYAISIIVPGLTIALAVIGGAAAQGKAAAAAFEAMARQPEAQSGINSSLILSLALIESLAIYALAVALIILFANPFLSYILP